jgi:ATP-dependent exoDNAse (exonuclease V) beta subunit
MRSIRDMAYTIPVARVLALIIETLELIPHFDKISKSKAEFEERQANVRELRKASERYTKSGPCLSREEVVVAENIDEFTQSPLGTFLDDVSLVTEMADAAERPGEERFVASLMTIHASKGMEFDAVFVVGNEDGTFPTSQALKEGDGSVVLEEERRLCYVAMTRAKMELFMTWRREVNIFTPEGVRTVDKDRSRFLDVLVSSKGKKSAGSGSPVTSGSESLSARTRSPPTFRGTTNVYSSQTSRRQTDTGQDRYRSPASQPRRSPETAANVSPKRPSARHEGTASVYAKRSPSPLDQPRSSEPARPSRSTRESRTDTRPSAQRAPPSKRQTKPAPARQTMDSTWFFPIGSEVMHDNHGRGIVLPPPQPKDQGELPVLVKFGDGERREFCGRGSDLTPVVP